MTHNFELVEAEREDGSYKFAAVINRPFVSGRVEVHKYLVDSHTPIDQLEQLALSKAREYEEELRKEVGP